MEYRFTKPIEMPRGSHYGSNYIILQSPKLGRKVTTFSSLEFYNLLQLEMDPDVEFYCEQPARLSTYLDEEIGIVHFTPDVYVVMRDGTERLIEVKYTSDLKDEKKGERTLRQIQAEGKYCRENGMRFTLSTEKTLIPSNFYVENRLQMVSYVNRSRYSFPERAFDDMTLYLINHPKVTVQDLVSAGIIESSRALAFVSVAIFNGKARVNDNGRTFGLNTEVYSR